MIASPMSRAFITQFSRSLHMEYLRTGIDILVAMPYLVVSKKYRKDHGTLFSPMPPPFVQGTLKQLGKKYFWQVSEEFVSLYSFQTGEWILDAHDHANRVSSESI